MRVARVAMVLVALGVAAPACSSSSDKTAPTPTSKAASGPNEFGIVYDDAGLHVPQGRRPAGTYAVSFVDHRSRKPISQRVTLDVIVSGPEITLFNIPAGTRRTLVLLADEGVNVVINGVRHRGRPPIASASLNIYPSGKYPTPAT